MDSQAFTGRRQTKRIPIAFPVEVSDLDVGGRLRKERTHTLQVEQNRSSFRTKIPRSVYSDVYEGIRVKMSTAKQFYETAAKIDSEQRNHLLLEQLPLVRYIAKRIHVQLPQHVALEDLVHAGVIGLIDALHKYDPAKNVQLKSYAKFRIRGAILDSLRELDWSTRGLRKKARRLEQADHKLKDQLGRAATEPELAAEMGLGLDEFQRLRGELHGLDLGSLQAKTFEEVSDAQYCAYQPNGPAEDPFFLCLRSEMKEFLGRAIGKLSQKERETLALYYFEELTLKEVGTVLGVCESRVFQIHSAALVQLRAWMKKLLESRPAPNLTGQILPEPVAGTSKKGIEENRNFLGASGSISRPPHRLGYSDGSDSPSIRATPRARAG